MRLTSSGGTVVYMAHDFEVDVGEIDAALASETAGRHLAAARELQLMAASPFLSKHPVRTAG